MRPRWTDLPWALLGFTSGWLFDVWMVPVVCFGYAGVFAAFKYFRRRNHLT